jgi:hypothetical protein
MSKDEFTGLYVYMERRFNEIENKLDQKVDKEDFHAMQIVLDNLVAQQEAHNQEMAAMGYQLSRHDRWLHGLANHAQFTLRHEA